MAPARLVIICSATWEYHSMSSSHARSPPWPHLYNMDYQPLRGNQHSIID